MSSVGGVIVGGDECCLSGKSGRRSRCGFEVGEGGCCLDPIDPQMRN
jgi:hypothetical protein